MSWVCVSVCEFPFILSILFPASYLFTFSINFHVQSENSIQIYTQQQHSDHLTLCRRPAAPQQPKTTQTFPTWVKMEETTRFQRCFIVSIAIAKK